MKNIKNKIKFIAAATMLGATVSSCSLDMLPLNDVVLENFWRDKADVESVTTSCYTALQEGKDDVSQYVNNMIVWGECRSDNTETGTQLPVGLRNLMRGSLKTTNEYCDWAAMYNVINRCNTVLYYAPKVAERDPNYTESDLRITQAECKFLRALSYFTLIKTFKDVPFTLEPTIDDNVEMRLPQTDFVTILDALINDIDGCKNDAPRRFNVVADNTAKVTRAAMYSLLAELCLWRASDANLSKEEQNTYYRKCIEACDWVLNFKIQQYTDNNIEGLDIPKLIDPEVFKNYGYPLLSENVKGEGAEAFNSIFGDGNSFESIFEITYHYVDGSRKDNKALARMYGYGDNGNIVDQYVKGNERLMQNPPKAATFDNSVLFSTNTDYRSIISFVYTENGSFDINKYSCEKLTTKYQGTGTFSESDYKNLSRQRLRPSGSLTQNWIIYRMTEIMLFRAEAEIMLANNLDIAAAEEAAKNEENQQTPGEDTPGNARPRRAASVAISGAGLSTAVDLYNDAFNLICAVYQRSNPATKTTASAMPTKDKIKTFDDYETFLMNERRREFLFEGKRYFDLVRQARRIGNTSKFISALSHKFGDGGAAVSIKMLQMDYMYMPVLKSQKELNPNLVQNSTYLDEEQIVNQ